MRKKLNFGYSPVIEPYLYWEMSFFYQSRLACQGPIVHKSLQPCKTFYVIFDFSHLVKCVFT